MVPALDAFAARARRRALALLLSACALTASACGEPADPTVLGSWTLLDSGAGAEADSHWDFREDGTFEFVSFDSDRQSFEGLWERDGDSMRLEWRDADGNLWPEEFAIYADDERLAMYAFVDQSGGGGPGHAGDYVATLLRYLPDGTLDDAFRDWILLLDDGSAALNGFEGTWAVGDSRSDLPAIQLQLDINGETQEFGYLAVTEDVLAYRVYERAQR